MPTSRRPTIFDRMRPRYHAESTGKSGLVDAAQKWGYALTEMLLGLQPDFEKRAMRQYYQDPADPTHTWSGAGMKPDWARQWEAEGHSLDELKVRPPH